MFQDQEKKPAPVANNNNSNNNEQPTITTSEEIKNYLLDLFTILKAVLPDENTFKKVCSPHDLEFKTRIETIIQSLQLNTREWTRDDLIKTINYSMIDAQTKISPSSFQARQYKEVIDFFNEEFFKVNLHIDISDNFVIFSTHFKLLDLQVEQYM